MFDDFDLGNGYGDAGPSTIDAGSGGDYGISDVGQWAQPDDGSMYQSAFGYGDSGGALSPLFAMADSPSMGYDTSGTGEWAKGAPSQGEYSGDSARLDQKMAELNSQSKGDSSPLAKMFGMKTGSDGSMDWGDPKNLSTMLKALGVGGNLLSQILNKNKQANSQTAAQLATQLPQNPYNKWSPQQQQWADQYFNQKFKPVDQRERQYASEMRNPIVAGRGYAEGGDVEGYGVAEDGGARGPLGLIETDTSGQADDVQVSLSGGEYVFDADVVAALGDGNNAAGAKMLDELREAIRKRNRSAPPGEIPLPAKNPIQQLGLGE